MTIASTVGAFIDGCAAAIDRSPAQRQRDADAFAARVASTSWDATATAIADLIEATGAASGQDVTRRTP